MTNQEIGRILVHISEILQIQGENPFKIRAYTKASQTIENLPYQLSSLEDKAEISELNAYPERLDLSDFHCRKAKEKGGRIAISTDAHRDAHLEWMIFGLATARRGWIEPKDVINTWNLSKLLKFLRRRACGQNDGEANRGQSEKIFCSGCVNINQIQIQRGN